MALLGKQQSPSLDSTTSPTSDHFPTHGNAFMAGKFYFISHIGVSWVLDSGATDHICHNLDMFDSYHNIALGDNTITIPVGRKVAIMHKGIVKVASDIILQDVLHVPHFHFNLISIPKLCQDLQCSVNFTSTSCVLQGPSLTHPRFLGKLQHGLYCTTPQPSKSSFNTVTFTHVASASSSFANKCTEEAKLCI